jgi:hypothetical protein
VLAEKLRTLQQADTPVTAKSMGKNQVREWSSIEFAQTPAAVS